MSDQQWPCIVCHRDVLEPSEPQTCVRCLGRVRSWLTDIRRWYPKLETEMTGRSGASRFPLGGSRDDPEPALPGGDVLVMAAPAADKGDDDSRNDPMPVAWLLCQWEDDWRSRLQLAPAHTFTVHGCARWLDERLAWAAQRHPAFDEFHDEIRDLHRELGAVTGQAELIDRGGKVPCPECGQPLIRGFADASPCDHDGPHCDHSHPKSARWPCRGSNTCGCDQGGRGDEWACSSRTCGRTLTEAEYWLAVRAEYERAGGDPMDDLATWLRARLDEDQAAAEEVEPLGVTIDMGGNTLQHSFSHARNTFASEDGMPQTESDPAAKRHFARHDPAHVLMDVEIKRAIVDHHQRVPDPDGDPLGDLCAICTETGPDAQGWPCRTLRLLALLYRDQDGYRDEWAPGA